MQKNNNFHDIYLYNLKDHINHYEYFNIPRNMRQKEKLMTSFCITNPVERVCYTAERKANIIFMYAEFLWYMKGDDSLDFICYYASNMKQYSMNNRTLTGTAYGRKLFKYNGVINQIKNIINLLKKEKETKRAVIVIFSPKELLIENNIDISCTISCQFFVRNNKLFMITNMRANDIYKGNLSDTFAFTMLQELISKELNVGIGDYYHIMGSSHLYECDFAHAEKVIQNSKPFSYYNYNFPQMPLTDNFKQINLVLLKEESLRKNYEKLNKERLMKLDLHDYWKQVVILLELYRENMYESKFDESLVECLNPVYKQLFYNRYLI